MIEMVIEGRARDLGGFSVRRVLPYAKRKTVGPFIFVDQMGPAAFPAGQGMDVRPHPHIGLATVTYLFEGAIQHKDSLGFDQRIEPGAVNWMTAGSGIVHSERTPPDLRASGFAIHGMQTWVALPKDEQERAPCFKHHPASTQPRLALDNARATLIAGSAYGMTAPAEVFSPMFYVDVDADAGAQIALPDDHVERAAYVASGSIALDGQSFGAGTLVIIEPGAQAAFTTQSAARVMLLGGDPIDAPRHIWWNFVHADEGRIEQAKDDWRNGRFPQVPGETEFIPLP
jgi:redox-sensitive bicupin YhaK (pirin superfamily)